MRLSGHWTLIVKTVRILLLISHIATMYVYFLFEILPTKYQKGKVGYVSTIPITILLKYYYDKVKLHNIVRLLQRIDNIV